MGRESQAEKEKKAETNRAEKDKQEIMRHR